MGAGLIGLKAALALKSRGLKVTVVERADRVLPEQLDEIGAGILEARIRAQGVEVLTGFLADAIETAGGRVNGVASGDRLLQADMVVICAGVKANTDLAQGAGLQVDAGIATNEFLQTSLADIYAAGDAAQVFNAVSKRPALSAGWPAAVEQGIIAARHMTGCQATSYQGYLPMNSVEIAGMPLVSAGDINGCDGVDIVVSSHGSVYKRLALKDNRLQGFLLMGDIRQAGVLAGGLLRSVSVRSGAALSRAFSFATLYHYEGGF